MQNRVAVMLGANCAGRGEYFVIALSSLKPIPISLGSVQTIEAHSGSNAI
jgi:hypothetical protein